MYSINKRFLSVIILIVISIQLTSCGIINKQDKNSDTVKMSDSQCPNASKQEIKQTRTLFDQFTNTMFIDNVQKNTINMHNVIAHPENYNIGKYKVSLGSFTIDSIQNDNRKLGDYLREINSYDYNLLTKKQQLTYDIVKTSLADALNYCDYYLLDEYLGTGDGQQQLLPVYLSEYSFYTEKDITDYLEILKISGSFFDSILEFEKLKAESGTFMNSFEADHIIDQCNEFIKDTENHYMITTFNDRINQFDGIDAKSKEAYKTRNKEFLNSSFFPSYTRIIDTLTELKEDSRNPGGLCKYEDGKDYYEGLIRAKTGSSRTIPEIEQLLKEAISNDITSIQKIYSASPDIDNHLKDYTLKSTSAKEIVKYLYKNIKKDFPKCAVTNKDVKIKSIPSATEKYESPAYYLCPPIDCLTDNNIYINKSIYSDVTAENMLSVLAHEGFPGHLFQITYFRNTSPDKIRLLQSLPGYSEGWGTYAEIYSYKISGLNPEAAEYNGKYTALSLELYSLMDIGINYNGWSLDETKAFGKTWGFSEQEITDIYNRLVENAGDYMQYSIGYLEIEAMKEHAATELGDDFSIKEFHKFILDTGPAQFEILNKYLDKWIADQRK